MATEEYKSFDKILYQFTGIDGRLYSKMTKTGGKKPDYVWTDGSSFDMRSIFNSDVLLVPDEATLRPWPFQDRTGMVFCDLSDKEKPLVYSPRDTLKRVIGDAKRKGYGYYTGAEMEFFLLPLGETGKPKMEFSDTDYYFAPVEEKVAALFEDAEAALAKLGITVEAFHHEVAQGQYEVSFKFDDALTSADNVQTVRQVLKLVSKRYDLYTTFMPKPFFGVNGSGMHVHESLRKGEENAFANGAGLSDLAFNFIAGQVKHAKGLAAAIAPTVNSYKRLVPGYEAPVYACWDNTNRSAMIRVPLRGDDVPQAARIELRCADPSCNSYVAFAAMLAAGMDGVEKKLKYDPVGGKNVYKLSKSERSELGIAELPSSLAEAVTEMEKNSVIMQALGEFGSKYLETLAKDAEEYRLAVTEWEREKYYTR